MDTGTPGGSFEDFLPELIVRYIKGCESRKRKPHPPPFSHDLEVVAMFVDISGFTKLSEALAKGGGLGVSVYSKRNNQDMQYGCMLGNLVILQAERLAFYLNRYFEQLARIVTKNSGDVFKFAGDALLAIWWQSEQATVNGAKIHQRKGSLTSYLDDDTEETLFEFSDDDSHDDERTNEKKAAVKRRAAKHRDLTLPCRRAIAAASDIQSELHSANLAQDITFSVKLGLGVGRMSLLFTGGVFGRAEYLANGPALKQAFLCEGDCSPGQLIVSNEVLKWIESLEIYDIVKLPSGNAQVQLSTDSETSSPTPMEPRRRSMVTMMARKKRYSRVMPQESVAGALQPRTTKGTRLRARNLRRTSVFSPKMLETFVPAAIVPHISCSTTPWASELRTLSIVFVNLGIPPEELHDATDEAVYKMHEAVKIVQSAIYTFEGSLNKFSVDDKGSTVLACFGLPPLAHENDPERAVLAALRVSADLRAAGLTASVGITTGVVFVGPLGAGNRREYSVIGDTVNTSARLMQMAPQCVDSTILTSTDDHDTFTEPVIVDTTTKESAESNPTILWNRLTPVQLKGKASKTQVWQPATIEQPRVLRPILWVNDEEASSIVLDAFFGLDSDIASQVQSLGHGQNVNPIEDGDAHAEHCDSLENDQYSEADKNVTSNGELLTKKSHHQSSSILIVLGDSGVGKTRLMRCTIDRIRELGNVKVCCPQCNVSEIMKQEKSSTGEPLVDFLAIKDVVDNIALDRSFFDDSFNLKQTVGSLWTKNDPDRKKVLQALRKPEPCHFSFATDKTSPVYRWWENCKMDYPENIVSLLEERQPSEPEVAEKGKEVRSQLRGVLTESELLTHGAYVKGNWLRVTYALGMAFPSDPRGFVIRQILDQVSQLVLSKTAPKHVSLAFASLMHTILVENLFVGAKSPSYDESEKLQVEAIVLIQLVALHCLVSPLAIFVDKTYLASKTCWALLEALCVTISDCPLLPCQIVISTRPLHEPRFTPPFGGPPKAYFRLMSCLGIAVVEIPRWTASHTTEMIASLLSIPRKKILPELVRLVEAMSAGNPRFTQKFLSGLLKIGILSAVGERDEVTKRFHIQKLILDLELTHFLPVPYRVQRQFATVFDRVDQKATPHCTLFLRIGAVLCMGGGLTTTAMDYEMLLGVLQGLGFKESADSWDATLHQLVAYNLIREERWLLNLDDEEENGVPEIVQRRRLSITDTYKERNNTEDSGSLETGNEYMCKVFIFNAGFARDALYHRTLQEHRRRIHKQAADFLGKGFHQTGELQYHPFGSRIEGIRMLYRHTAIAGNKQSAREIFDKHLSKFSHRSQSHTGQSSVDGSSVGNKSTDEQTSYHSLGSATSSKSLNSIGKQNSGRKKSLTVPVQNLSPKIKSGPVRRSQMDPMEKPPQTNNKLSCGNAFNWLKCVPCTSESTDISNPSEQTPAPTPLSSQRVRRRRLSAPASVAKFHSVRRNSDAGTLTPVATQQGPAAPRRSSVVSNPEMLLNSLPFNVIPILPTHAIVKPDEDIGRFEYSHSVVSPGRSMDSTLKSSDLTLTGDSGTPTAEKIQETNSENDLKSEGKREDLLSSEHHGKKPSLKQKLSTRMSSRKINNAEPDELVHEETTDPDIELKKLNTFHHQQPALKSALKEESIHSMVSGNLLHELLPVYDRFASTCNTSINGSLQTKTQCWRGLDEYGEKSRYCVSVQKSCLDSPTYERLNSLVEHLRNIDQWSFNVFAVDRASFGHALIVVADAVMKRRNLLGELGIPEDVFHEILVMVESGHNETVPFHNTIHTADVVQTTHVLLSDPYLRNSISSNAGPLSIFGCLVGALGHDLDHPGVSEEFLKNVQHPLATSYSYETSILEQHHAAKTFEILKNANTFGSIYSFFEPADQQVFRTVVARCIMATSLTGWHEFFDGFMPVLSAVEAWQILTQEECLTILEAVIKTSDLSASVKPFSVSREWSRRITAEFFEQGDMEREVGLPVSKFSDRQKNTFARCQLEFIQKYVKPLLDNIESAVPVISSGWRPHLSALMEFYRTLDERLQESSENVL